MLDGGDLERDFLDFLSLGIAALRCLGVCACVGVADLKLGLAAVSLELEPNGDTDSSRTGGLSDLSQNGYGAKFREFC